MGSPQCLGVVDLNVEFQIWPIFQRDVIASKLDVLWFLIHSTKKKRFFPAPHMLLLRQNSFMSHSADFVLGIRGPLFTFFANLEPNLQPQLHMKPFITNPPPTRNLQKTVEDDSYKLRTSYAEKSTNSPPATLGIPWDSLPKTRKPALGGGVTTWRCCGLRVWKKHRLLRGLDESYLQIVGKAFKMTILWGVYIYIYDIYILDTTLYHHNCDKLYVITCI